jgi:hypothetical protein
MKRSEIIKKLREMPSDIEGHVAAGYAIEAILLQDRKYCPWCDLTVENQDIDVTIQSENYFGFPEFVRKNIEYNYCPMCGRNMDKEW